MSWGFHSKNVGLLFEHSFFAISFKYTVLPFHGRRDENYYRMANDVVGLNNWYEGSRIQ